MKNVSQLKTRHYFCKSAPERGKLQEPALVWHASYLRTEKKCVHVEYKYYFQITADS